MRQKIYASLKTINTVVLDISYSLGLRYVPAFPEGVMVEPSSICNLRCPLCPISTGDIKRKREQMDVEKFKEIFRVPRYFLQYMTFWNFGEPLLNRDVAQMINYVAKTGVKTQLSTNGLVYSKENILELLQSGLHTLIISIDTFDPEEYKKYRIGGDLFVLLENYKKIMHLKRDIKSNTRVCLQFMILRSNQEKLDKIYDFGQSLQPDELVVKTIGIGAAFESPSANQLSFLPSNRYLRYDPVTLKSKVQVQKRCKYVWKRTVVCSDMTLLPCCRDQKGRFILGDLNTGTLFQQFNSKAYQDFRSKINTYQRQQLMCRRCPEEVKKNVESNTNDYTLR